MFDLAPMVRPAMVLASVRNVVVTCNFGELTADDIRAMNDRHARIRDTLSGAPLYAILMIAAGTRAPSAEVRNALSDQDANAPNASAVVLDQATIPIAIVRSVMATVQFLAPRSVKVDAFREAEPAYAWLRSRASADGAEIPPWGEVAALIERVRSLRPR